MSKQAMNTSADAYAEKFADIYDKIHHFKDYAREIAYVLGCINFRLPHAKALLDVACGTGNHIAGLSSAFKVEGIDASEAMLKRARQKFPQTLFHLGNMMDFDLRRRFDVITCLFRTIAFAETRENLCLAICCMARHLRPGGLLLIEPFFTPETYWIRHLKLNILDQPDCKVSWMYISEREGDVAVMNNHYLVGSAAGVEHFEEEHRLGLFRREDYEEAFENAGLELEHDPVGPDNIGLYIGRKI